MRYFITAFAALALVLGGCEAADDAGASPLGTVDLFESPAAGAADASPEETLEASPTESPDLTATESPDETSDASPGATAEDDDATASPAATDDADVAAAASCEEAFGEVPDLARMDSLSDLREAFDALDETIEACESVDEWIEQAEEQLELANLNLDAEEFLESRCEESEALAETELCESV